MKKLIFSALVSLFPIVCFANDANDDGHHFANDDRHHFDNDDRRHKHKTYNVQSVTGELFVPGAGPTAGASFAFSGVAFADPTKPAPGTTNTVTVTKHGSSFVLNGINITASSFSEGFSGPKLGPFVGSFSAPKSPTIIASDNLSFASFGAWQSTTPTTPPMFTAQTYGAYAAGVPASHIPKNGTGVYTGPAFGWISIFILPTNSTVPFTGTSLVKINFFTRDVTTNIAGAGSGESFTLAGSGKLSGGSYNLTLTGKIDQCSVCSLTGPASGKLYGPGAEQTAGTFMTGPGVGPFHVYGAFGGTRH